MAVLLAGVCGTSSAQSYQDDYEQFRQSMRKDYEDYRQKCFAEYTDFVSKAWVEMGVKRPIPKPKEEMVIPQIAQLNEATESWLSRQVDWVKDKIKKVLDRKPADFSRLQKSNPVKVSEVLTLDQGKTYTQPQPLSPVKDHPQAIHDFFTFRSFGTNCVVRMGDKCRFRLGDISSEAIAQALKKMMTSDFDNLLHDCLNLRKTRQLSDWAYYEMLCSLVDQFYGPESNEGTLVLANLYMQSGYKMRMGHDQQHLYVLLASDHTIMEKSYFVLDNEKYYVLRGKDCARLFICEVPFPKESVLSLRIPYEQVFANNPVEERRVTSLEYPSFSFSYQVNKNVIDFYNTYPSSTINQNVMTRWAMYANTPLEGYIKDQIYPQMALQLSGLSRTEAVSRLLNWVQTGFEYGYDSMIWGGDRAFFGEETLYYPYCDCEDRSILLSHLVRDLLDLDVILVYYPESSKLSGHLAMAVDLIEPSNGDYIPLNGRRFTICDPTFIGAPVGLTMTGYNNRSAQVILLDK